MTAASSVLNVSLGTAISSTAVHVDSLDDAAKNLSERSLSAVHLTVVGADVASGTINPMHLSAFVPALKDQATVSFHIVGEGGDLSVIHKSFLLAGLKGVNESKQGDGSRVLTATYKLTTATVIPLEDLMDEDVLLMDTSNLLPPPPSMSSAVKNGDDCGGRQPCDDCTCGRADAQKGENTTVKTSSCGKCGLGDAFRCASCPYLGKPAFKNGEEHLVLDLQDDL